MRRFTKVLFAGLFGATTLVAVGCQTDNKPAQSNPTVSKEGVSCDKCQTTWVQIPNRAAGRQGGEVVGYSTQKSHACPDCKSAAENFFATGKLEHACKTCGGNTEVCQQH